MRVLVTVVCLFTKVAQVTTVTCTYFDSTKNETLELIVKTIVISVFFASLNFAGKSSRAKTPPFTPNRAQLINI